ncbi:hypothetical protein EON65_13865, partial [archaeon]
MMKPGEEETFAVNYLNLSVHRHLTDLQSVLETFVNRTLKLEYEFKHTFMNSSAEGFADFGYEQEQCIQDCYRNCSHFPLLQASMHNKQYVSFISTILLDHTIDIDITSMFGSEISLQFFDSLNLLQYDLNHTQYRTHNHTHTNTHTNAQTNTDFYTQTNSHQASSISTNQSFSILDTYPQLSIQ